MKRHKFGFQLLLATAAAVTTVCPLAAASRIAVGASMQAPLPRGLEVISIATAPDVVWFLTRQAGEAQPLRYSLYRWAKAGIKEVMPDGVPEGARMPSQLLADPSGAAWLVTAKGLNRCTGDGCMLEPGFDELSPRAIAGGSDLWVISGESGLYYLPAWLPGAAEKLEIPGAQGVITRWTIEPNGDLYFAVSTPFRDQIFRASRALRKAVPVALPGVSSLPRVSLLYADSLGDLWISLASGGLLRFASGTLDRYTPGEGFDGIPLTAMAEDERGNLLLFHASLPDQEATFLAIPSSARSQVTPEFRRFYLDRYAGTIAAAAVDNDGGTWVGVSGRGALRLEGLSGLGWLRGPETHPTGIVTEPAGGAKPEAKAAPAGDAPAPKGVLTFGPLTNVKFAHLFKARGLVHDAVSSTVADASGNVYFTTGHTHLTTLPDTAGAGVSKWDHRVFTSLTTAQGLASNTVQCSLFDAANNLVWFGTDLGLSRYNPSTGSFLPTLLSGVNVHDIKFDGAGKLWVGSYGNGVYRFNPATGAQEAQFTKASTGGGLIDDRISGLAFAGGVLWVGTDGVGASSYNGSTWTPLSLAALGYDNYVLDVESDNDGNVWMSSLNRGVVRRKADGTFQLFNGASGLGPSSNIVYVIYRDLGGNLWFGFGGYGGVASPQVATTFLAASEVSKTAPAFQNLNSTNADPSDPNNKIPNHLVISVYSENASTLWFGFSGGGVARLGGPADAPGWPQTTVGYVATSGAALADLDGNGNLEVIIGDMSGRVYAFRPNGSLLWSYDARNAFPAGTTLGDITIQSSPAVGDVDGDGDPEVVVGVNGFVGKFGPTLNVITTGQGAVLVLSKTGALKRAFYPYDITDRAVHLSKQDGFREQVYATPLLANVDDDPEPEILVAALDNFFYGFNADGSTIYARDNDGDGKFDEDFIGDFTPFTPFDSSDDFPGWRFVDDDGNGEVDEGNIYDDDEDWLLDEDYPEFPFHLNDSSVSSAAAADLFGTGRPVIVVGQDWSGGGGFARGGLLRVIDTEGKEAPGWPRGADQTIMSSPALADLDGDGTLEIVHGTGLDASTIQVPPASNLLVGQRLYAWRRDGSSYIAGANPPGQFATVEGWSFSSPAVGDLDGDGKPEVVLVTSMITDKFGNPVDASGNPTSGPNAIGQKVYAFNSNGNLLPGFPVRPFPWIANTVITGSPAIADINGDGFQEIIVPAGFGLIVLDRNGRTVSGMGLFENLHDPVSQVFTNSSPAVGDIDGDGILEVVWAAGLSSDGGQTATSGIVRVFKLGPARGDRMGWPMFRRIAERNGVYDVFVSQPQIRGAGPAYTITARVLAGRSPISSVTADLSAAGGPAAQPLNDSGAGGDAIANDGVWTASVSLAPPAGRYYLPVTAADSAGRSHRGLITLVRRGAGRLLSTTLTAIDFGAVGRGLNKEMHFGMMNVGDAALTVSSVSSSNSEFFVAIPESFPQTIAPGGVLNLRLRVRPGLTATGSRTAVLTITSNADINPVRTVSLAAQATTLNAGIQWNVMSSAWPNTSVGSFADNVVLSITSKGPDPLIIQDVQFGNPMYTVSKPSNPPFPRTYEAGRSTTMVIRFRPTSGGPQNTTMRIFTNDPANPTISVPLTAAGIGCTATPAVSTVNVPETPSTGSVTINGTPGCGWTVISTVAWVKISPPAGGAGSGSFTYSVLQNVSSLARSGTVLVNGAAVTFNQARNPGTFNERFVTLVYNNFLGRQPDPGGFSFWVGRLNSGALTRAQMAAAFFTSAEFGLIERFDAGLYVGILGRDAEYEGWDFHRRNLRSGVSTQQGLVTGFLGSLEYQLRYGNPSNEQFVTILYQNCFNRTPSAQEVSSWVSQLTSGVSRTAVAQVFLNAPEFTVGRVTRLNVFLMYAVVLSRTPDPGGFAAWVAYLESGNTLEQALNGFVNSPEFLGLIGP